MRAEAKEGEEHMTRETPYVGGLPIPWWLQEWFRQDEDGRWYFFLPMRHWIYIDLSEDPAAEGNAIPPNETVFQWRLVIAGVAEVAWRGRAERYRMLMRIKGCFVGAWRCDVSPSAECRKLIDESEPAVAACRKWGNEK